MADQSTNNAAEGDAEVKRGRAIVEEYARRSPEFAGSLDEHTSVIGDFIADLLAYVQTIPYEMLPPAFRGSTFQRIGAILARGGWNALSALEEREGSGGDPTTDVLAEVGDAFVDYLAHA